MKEEKHRPQSIFNEFKLYFSSAFDIFLMFLLLAIGRTTKASTVLSFFTNCEKTLMNQLKPSFTVMRYNSLRKLLKFHEKPSKRPSTGHERWTLSD
jgi:hypothetical protein